MSPGGFDSAAVALLERLPLWTAEEYAAHKSTLVEGLTRPGGELIAAVAERVDSPLTVVPRSSVSPLHRDLRFAVDGAPRYKDHLLLTTWEGSDKRRSAMFWIRVDARDVGFPSGIGFDPIVRERWRSAVGGDPGVSLAAELDRLVRQRSADIAGDRTTRVPAPFTDEHPHADLLRHTGFQVRFVEPHPGDIGRPELVDWCVDHPGAILPVHRWLVTHLTDPAYPRRKDRTMPQTDETVFWELIEELRLDDPRVEEGTIMGGRCARVAGEFLGLVDFKGSGLVVKLPRSRVQELIDEGVGQPFAPAGRVFKEWVSVPNRDRRRWRALLREAAAFVAPG